MKNVSIIGSTGSIGRQALEVVTAHRDRYRVVALAAGQNWRLLLEQIVVHRPQLVAVATAEAARQLDENLPPGTKTEIYWGEEGLLACATCPEAQVVLTAVPGILGLSPTLAAINRGKDIALANKETLVAAGQLVMEQARRRQVAILPVDSEHSAIWQCLDQKPAATVAGIILTASGGPFRQAGIDLHRVTPEMALSHPNWRMGKKVTVDSATLFNKGLEVIEAHWLFGLDYQQIEVVIHPQSIIHSLVRFVDGSVLAQLGLPDMKVPIAYALSYPDRLPGVSPAPDFCRLGSLTFEAPDRERFPMLDLAYQAGRCGGTAPALLNAANEIGVEYFLTRRIGFADIFRLCSQVMELVPSRPVSSLEDIMLADKMARAKAGELISSIIH
ncbi:MAG: 1-deoxy-D-xylulose-5-phosphate reductoisomerase [Desulfurispora sp.]|uniref:1-deoxy-D-xylulose-5-phosphate reductoisomerase n=1 Tax=Desulfurispora sp. TaxID=3014275 RepID=UPI00404B1EBA